MILRYIRLMAWSIHTLSVCRLWRCCTLHRQLRYLAVFAPSNSLETQTVCTNFFFNFREIMQVKWKGVWKIAIFRQMSGFISNDTRHGQIWHRGRCPRGSCMGRVWSLKLKGCKFYRGLQFGLLHWLCLWELTQCSATLLPVMIYRTAPFALTLNDPYPQLQGHAVIWRWISQKRYEKRT